MVHVKYETEKTLRVIEIKFVTFVVESLSSKRIRIKTNRFCDILIAF